MWLQFKWGQLSTLAVKLESPVMPFRNYRCGSLPLSLLNWLIWYPGEYFHRIPRVTSNQEPLGQKQRPQEQSTYQVPGSWFLNAILKEQETRAPWIPSLRQGRYKMSLDILLFQKARKYSNTNGSMSKRHRRSLEGTLTGPIWDNLSIEKNNENGLTNIITKEFHGPRRYSKKGLEERKCFFIEKRQLIKCTRDNRIGSPF